MSGIRTIGVSQRRSDSKEKKKEKLLVRVGSTVRRSQPRNWAECIHEFICRQWVGSGRSEESGDGVVGVAKVMSSIIECSFDSGSDKSYPGF